MASKILGISASLRNARRGLGNTSLIKDIENLQTKEELFDYLKQEAKDHLDNFMESGRKESIPFDQLYTNLKKLKGNKGLSNSEVALVSALWSSHQLGSEISHVSLSEYFTEGKKSKNIEELKQKIIEADGIILSTPVYFGDRGSLAQSLINLIRRDSEFKKALKGKIYGGISVGAKRNGGQETTLIYQLLDMIDCNLLGVGNDSETTSQYGGTGLAGDIGTMPEDSYGLATAMGTGRRVSRVATMFKNATNTKISGKHKIVFWILQDKENYALKYVTNIINNYLKNSDCTILDIVNKTIIRCLACDICPTHIALDEEYRCIINSKKDDLEEMHDYFLDADAIIPVALCVKDKNGLESNYQRFLERTRYIRRGDYVMSDIIAAPFIIEELGASENLSTRIITSTIRHHTIVAKPIISFINKGKELNRDDVIKQFINLEETISNVAKARLLAYSSNVNHLRYNPVGYVLSSEKDKEDEKLAKRSSMIENRVERSKKIADTRLFKN